jgi:hypothetical protein
MGTFLTYTRNQWDRCGAALALAACIVVVTLGWIGAASTAYASEQIPYVLSGGVGGLILLGISCTLWLSADLRDEWRKLDSLEALVREHLAPTADPTVAAEPLTEAREQPGVAANIARPDAAPKRRSAAISPQSQ